MCAYVPKQAFFGKYPYKITSLAVFLSRNRVEIWQFCQPATPQYFPTARTGFGAASSLEEATELGAKKSKEQIVRGKFEKMQSSEIFYGDFPCAGPKGT